MFFAPPPPARPPTRPCPPTHPHTKPASCQLPRQHATHQDNRPTNPPTKHFGRDPRRHKCHRRSHAGSSSDKNTAQYRAYVGGGHVSKGHTCSQPKGATRSKWRTLGGRQGSHFAKRSNTPKNNHAGTIWVPIKLRRIQQTLSTEFGPASHKIQLGSTIFRSFSTKSRPRPTTFGLLWPNLG